MKRPVSFLLLSFALLQVACIFRTPADDVLHTAQALMEIAPDSALALLRGLDTASLRGRSRRARHALLLSQALDKNYIDLESDSVIAPAVRYYAKHGSRRDKAYTSYYLACIRYNAGEIDRAVRAMVDARAAAEAIGDSYLLGRIYGCLGRMYQDQHSFAEAEAAFSRAEEIFSETGDSLNAGYVLMNQAMVHSLMGDSERAKIEYRRTVSRFYNMGDTIQAGLLIRCLVDEMKEDETIPTDTLKHLLQQAYAFTSTKNIPSADYSLWAAICLREEKIDAARKFSIQALNERTNNVHKKCGILLRLCTIEEKSGKYRKATEYWHEYVTLYDSITRAEREQLIDEAEKKYHNLALKHANALLQAKNHLINIGWGLAMTTGLSLFVRFYRRLNRQHKEHIGDLEENYASLKERCEQLHQEIGDRSAEEAALFRILETRLKDFQDLLDKAYGIAHKPQKFLDIFQEYVQSMGKDKPFFALLRQVVDKRNYGLVDCLRKLHPELTNSELDLLCMIRIGFTLNCIRLLLHHGNQNSIYSRRNKIHRKLQLPAGQKLGNYLETLVRKLEGQMQYIENEKAKPLADNGKERSVFPDEIT